MVIRSPGALQLDYPETYPYSSQLVSDRDQFFYQGAYSFTAALYRHGRHAL